MYSDEIQRVRNEAQETKVANTIIDLLDKLQLNSNGNSCRRWIWELIQNAKDVLILLSHIPFQRGKHTIHRKYV